MLKYTAILNVFQRDKNLVTQIEHLNDQSFKPSEILIWNNGNKNVDLTSLQAATKIPITLSQCSENLGVWARFAFALNSRYKFILLLDDDILPGKRWVENCYENFLQVEGLYGTRGVSFLSSNRYTPFEHVGWRNPNNERCEVDIIGHSWFFKREWLTAYWELADIESYSPLAGEDMQMSFAIQKKYGLGSYVPPHPEHDKEMWGNILLDNQLSEDEHAISLADGAFLRFDAALQKLNHKGFQIKAQRNDNIANSNVPIVNTNALRKTRLARWIKAEPNRHKFFHKIVLFLRKKLKIHL